MCWQVLHEAEYEVAEKPTRQRLHFYLDKLATGVRFHLCPCRVTATKDPCKPAVGKPNGHLIRNVHPSTNEHSCTNGVNGTRCAEDTPLSVLIINLILYCTVVAGK